MTDVQEKPFVFQVRPFNHQLSEWLKTRDKTAWGRLWEMGTGKSKTTIDEVAWLFLTEKINGLLVIAPNGVHRNWVVEELPKHLPLSPSQVLMHWYSNEQHNSKVHREAIERICRPSKAFEKLHVLSMSYDSLMTEHGRQAAKDFLTNRKCMHVLDESRRIKEPTAKRTKRVIASQPHSLYRRILNGTPITQGPFDMYSQIRFLDPTFWVRHGISTYAGFKTTFAEYKPITVAGGKVIKVVSSYKNLDMLNRWLSEISSRVTKDDVLDLPPKLFSKYSFDMCPAQRRVYDQLRDEFMTVLESGELVTAEMALTRMLRLQQVTCGYVPADLSEEPTDISKDNPRLELLEQLCEDVPHKAIVWCRFKRDIDKITTMLGDLAVRYDGSVGEDARALALDRFQKPGGDAKFFVGNPSCAGEGLTLHAAKSVFYYSNSFNLGDRLQSEDRAHRIGQDRPVNYGDLVATGTVDEHVADALVRKLDVACQITGDTARNWLA